MVKTWHACWNSEALKTSHSHTKQNTQQRTVIYIPIAPKRVVPEGIILSRRHARPAALIAIEKISVYIIVEWKETGSCIIMESTLREKMFE